MNNLTIIPITCRFCGGFHFVRVNEDDFDAWQSGMFAQDAFPYLSDTEREQLISTMCPKCQSKFFTV